MINSAKDRNKNKIKESIELEFFTATYDDRNKCWRFPAGEVIPTGEAGGYYAALARARQFNHFMESQNAGN